MMKKIKYALCLSLLFSSFAFAVYPVILGGFAVAELVLATSIGGVIVRAGTIAADPRVVATVTAIYTSMANEAALVTQSESAYLGSLFRDANIMLTNGDSMSWASNGLLTYESTGGQGSNPSPVGTTNNCITVSGSDYCTTELGETEFLSSLINSSSAKDLIPSTECEACFITQVYYPMYCAGGTCLLPVALSYNHPDYGVQPYGQESISFGSGSIPSGQSCQNTKDGVCFAFPTGGSTYSDLDPEALKNLLSPEQLAQPIPADFLADYFDKTWQEVAAQPGYDGFPYQFSNPVLPSDVNAASQPVTVGDLLAANAVTPATGSSPATVAPSTQSDGTIIPPKDPNAQNVDFGPDPGIGAPSVTPPSIESILAPIFDMLPDYKNANFQDGHGVCTPLEFHAMGLYKVTTVHCDLFEQVKPIIHLIMSLIWLFVAIRIVLEA